MTLAKKYNGYVPLSKIVSAAMVDTYNTDGSKEELFIHWAARGMRKLYNEDLPRFYEKVLLPVNCNTLTATLPCDVEKVSFVGIIKGGRKYPLYSDSSLVNAASIKKQNVEYCDKCGQDKSICNSLDVTEETNHIRIGADIYDEEVVKKMYPNGDYFLERNTPFLNTDTGLVVYRKTKEFIENIDLLECGCPNPSSENKDKLKQCCPIAYACGCDVYTGSSGAGKYKIFEDIGLVQLSPDTDYEEIYVEYVGFLPKVNGKYVVPDVAFETLVEWTKYKAIQNKPNTPVSQKQLQLEDYKRERRNMEKARGKVSLSHLVHTLRSLPTIVIEGTSEACKVPEYFSVPDTQKNRVACSQIGGATVSSTTINNNNITIFNKAAFTLAVTVDGREGSPIAGEITYQNDALKGAVIEYILINNTIETKLSGDFTFDSPTGTINRSPNVFAVNDVLIINYNAG